MIIDGVRGALMALGIWVEKATPTDLVRDWIRTVRPSRNGRGLRRFGPKADGGYLMPDDLTGISACISPGVSDEAGFDWELAERGITIYMIDGSVEGPPIPHPNFKFTKKFLGLGGQPDTISLDNFVSSCGDSLFGDLILQMDIEGAEYDVFPGLSDDLLRSFRIIVIELHDLHRIFSSAGYARIRVTTEKLTRHHACVHAHPNNLCGAIRLGDVTIPRVMEFTFYRRDRDVFSSYDVVPERHALDEDNVPGRAPLPLPRCWR